MSEQQLVIFICGLIAGLILGRGIGFYSGYSLGMKIARQWEEVVRIYESRRAKSNVQGV